MAEGNRTKIKSKADIGKADMFDADMFGNRLRVPPHIQEELDKKGLVARFVSIRKLQESGGYHPMGWTPYIVESPRQNPIDGSTEKTFRVGDLVLAVKTREAHAKHRKWLEQKAQAQTQNHKNSVKEMRDRIKDSRADKHIALIEGYEENGDEE
jgi:hypothetical protein